MGFSKNHKRHEKMKTIVCNNSQRKSVVFFNNGGINILAIAQQDGEYWFTIGHFNTLSGAKRSAKRQMLRSGYTFDENELNSLTLD